MFKINFYLGYSVILAHSLEPTNIYVLYSHQILVVVEAKLIIIILMKK